MSNEKAFQRVLEDFQQGVADSQSRMMNECFENSNDDIERFKICFGNNMKKMDTIEKPLMATVLYTQLQLSKCLAQNNDKNACWDEAIGTFHSQTGKILREFD